MWGLCSLTNGVVIKERKRGTKGKDSTETALRVGSGALIGEKIRKSGGEKKKMPYSEKGNSTFAESPSKLITDEERIGRSV